MFCCAGGVLGPAAGPIEDGPATLTCIGLPMVLTEVLVLLLENRQFLAHHQSSDEFGFQ